MLFNSIEFIILCSITFLVFYLPFLKQWQRQILVASSFTFYAYNNPVLLILFIISLLINSSISYVVLRTEYKNKYFLTAVGVTINLGILSVFKYSPLFAKSILTDFTKGSFGETLLQMPLPIGISFYTFQGISLLLDVWWGKNSKKVKKYIDVHFGTHMLNSILFISFFPQLIAGPILKSSQFIPQIKEKFFSDIDWAYASKYLILGYFFKAVIADNLGYVTNYVTYPYFAEYSGASLVLFTIGYAFQLFADFGGYSFIALGLGELFGYRLVKNFNFPYISSTFSEYWKRWHITLYEWFNFYVYNPFVFAYRYWGQWSTVLGIIIVFLLSGIWHGSSWNFAIWGLLHGFILVLEVLVFSKIKIKQTVPVRVFKILFVFAYVLISYVFFKFDDFSHIMYFFESVYSNWGFYLSRVRFETYIVLYGLPVLIYHLYFFLTDSQKDKWVKPVKPLLYAIMIIALLLDAGSAKEFIYFQF
jgi:alginate O-acetyltransferase complex protein AlgI